MTSEPNSTRPLRLAMLGMVDGNGHPYSWSAIVNGFDPEAMAECPYPVIPKYLTGAGDAVGIPDVKVTHIWTDDPADARKVARASLTPNIVDRAEDVIGHVDAVLVATDKGHEHVERCRPFVDAGLPVFVDKPMVDNESDLRTFQDWCRAGKPILSTSCMRYSREFEPLRTSKTDLGELRFATVTTCKSWERYGIHALEAIYPILGPGFLSARNTGTAGRDIVHFKHSDGIDVCAVAIDDMYGSFGTLQLCGTKGHQATAFADTFHAFKSQLEAFINFVRTGDRPFPVEETEELMRMLIAALLSREQNGREILLKDIAA